MFAQFDKKAQKVIVVAESIAFDLGSKEIETHHLLLSILKDYNALLTKILNKKGVNENIIYNEIVRLFGEKDDCPFHMEYSSKTKAVIKNAIATASQKGLDFVSINILSIELLKSKNCTSNALLENYSIDINEIIKKLDDESGYFVIEGCENFTTVIKPTEEKIILGRDYEVREILIDLCCNEKSNIALLGKAGVGKTAVVEELARLLKYDPPEKLQGYQIISFDSTRAISGTKYRGEFEDKINKLLKGIENRKVIIFIDEGHILSKLGAAEGSPSISELLKPILAREGTKFIIATTKEEYQLFIAQNKAFSRRFRNIIIHEPHIDDVPKMIKKKIDKYSKFHNVSISNEDIKEVIDLSKDIPNRYFPDKALDVIDYTMSYCEFEKNTIFDVDIAKNYINGILGKKKSDAIHLIN